MSPYIHKRSHDHAVMARDEHGGINHFIGWRTNTHLGHGFVNPEARRHERVIVVIVGDVSP